MRCWTMLLKKVLHDSGSQTISQVLSVWKGHLKDLIKFLTALGACGVVTGLCVEHVRDACWAYGHCWCPIVRKDIRRKKCK